MDPRNILRGLLFGVVILFAILALLGWRMLGTSPLRSALPSSAMDVADQLVEQPPDFDYLLRACLPERDFSSYIARLALKPITTAPQSPNDITGLSWTVTHNTPSWWTPTSALESTFVAHDGPLWTFAKYENGWLYLRCRSLAPSTNKPTTSQPSTPPG